METASQVLFSLQPVTFRYKTEIDPKGTTQCGLVAEDVEKVNPDLVVPDKEGKPYSVRYDQVDAMLLNEFLKAHQKVEEQQVTIAELKDELQTVRTQKQKDLQTLTARLEEQAAQIQEMSAQLVAASSPVSWRT